MNTSNVHVGYFYEFNIKQVLLKLWSQFKNIYWTSPLWKTLSVPGTQYLPWAPCHTGAAHRLVNAMWSLSSRREWPELPERFGKSLPQKLTHKMDLEGKERGQEGVYVRNWPWLFQDHLCLTCVLPPSNIHQLDEQWGSPSLVPMCPK